MIENKRDSFEIDDESLGLLSCKLDKDQLSAVKETKNVVVSAGAGSGKTTVLASRYAYLVEAKNLPCEKILTLTFTKKAANEMKDRIFNGLKYHLEGKDIKGKESLPATLPRLSVIKERAKKAIESFDKAHIQTLDSYFSEIAKKGAHYYGITPGFTLDADKITSKIRYKATKYVLDHLDAEEIKQISQIFQIQNLAEDLFVKSILSFSTVLTPIDFTKSLKLQKERLTEDYANLTEKISDTLATVTGLERKANASPTLVKLYNYIDETGNPAAPVLSESVFETENAAKAFLDQNFLPYCRDLSGYISSSFSSVSDQTYKAAKKELLSLLEKLYLLANSISSFDLIKKVYFHMEAFQKNVIRTKRTSGLLTFADVSELALRTLSEHSEIRAIEKQKFDAIMIDEFQDDNSLQCDVLLILCDQKEKFDSQGNYLLPKLSAPDLLTRLDTHKLFFVGDDKQSIYRFRGADVSVFRSLSDSIKNSIELKTNYRSEAGLIYGFNTLFGGYDYPSGQTVNQKLPAIFMTREKFPTISKDKPQIPDFEADYKKVEVPSFRLENADLSKKISIALYPKSEKEEEESTAAYNAEKAEEERKVYECEASYVAREIQKLLQEKTIDKEGREVQKYHYKDIALLFRTATQTPAYENVLLRAGIPYSTEVYKGFFSDGPINDIISLLKLCVYPEDKNAYAKLLRSPFCSLTFAQMQKVLVNTESPYKLPFSSQMLEAIADDEELFQKITSLKSLYEDIKERLKNEKLSKTISYIWYEAGYRYETMWNKSVSMYSSFYDILFEMARLAEEKTQSLATFIDMVKSYESSDQKLEGLDVVMDAEDAVQILTIHKSKGLEFKVVFVCAVSAPPKPGSDNIAYSKELGFIIKTPSWNNYNNAAEKLAASGTIRKNIAKNYFFSLLKEEAEKQESAELRRLAYVAFTRAEERLYIVGNENREFSDEVDAIEKSRRFELHSPQEKSFIYTKTHKKEKGEIKELRTPKEEEVEYKEPNSIYQLLLPILYDGACEDGVNNPSFNFVNKREEFETVSIEKADEVKKEDFIKKLSDSPEANIIEKKLSPKVYVSPSKLKNSAPSDSSAQNSQKSPSAISYENSVPANPDYDLINRIVESTVPLIEGKTIKLEDEGEETSSQKETSQEDSRLVPDFGFNNFGTIAHACMEAKILGREMIIASREWLGLNERFIKNVKMEGWKGDTNREKKISKIKEICQDMASRLESSTIYKEALASDWKKTEYTFRSLIENALPPSDGNEYAKDLIVTGQIDLLYKNDAASPYKYTIADYKTNQHIKPEIYYSQLSCYRKAVSQMLGVNESEIRCVLYYLRYAKEIDITQMCR